MAKTRWGSFGHLRRNPLRAEKVSAEKGAEKVAATYVAHHFSAAECRARSPDRATRTGKRFCWKSATQSARLIRRNDRSGVAAGVLPEMLWWAGLRAVPVAAAGCGRSPTVAVVAGSCARSPTVPHAARRHRLRLALAEVKITFRLSPAAAAAQPAWDPGHTHPDGCGNDRTLTFRRRLRPLWRGRETGHNRRETGHNCGRSQQTGGRNRRAGGRNWGSWATTRRNAYSYRSASIGSSREAFQAG